MRLGDASERSLLQAQHEMRYDEEEKFIGACAWNWAVPVPRSQHDQVKYWGKERVNEFENWSWYSYDNEGWMEIWNMWELFSMRKVRSPVGFWGVCEKIWVRKILFTFHKIKIIKFWVFLYLFLKFSFILNWKSW